MNQVVSDAAAPLGVALARLYEQSGYVWRPRDVAISYSSRGVIAAVDEEVADDQCDRIKSELWTAFRAAGWGLASGLLAGVFGWITQAN